MKEITGKLFGALFVLLFILTSCGDDPTSVTEDPPKIPKLQNVQTDLTYFQENPPQNENSNYSQAYSIGIGIGSLASISQFYMSPFSLAEQEEPDFVDGRWEWNYDYTFEGQSVSITLIAEEVDNFIEWEMLWSGDDGQGNSFEDYRLVEGRTAVDGTSGSWTFNALNPDTNEEEPALRTEWIISGENNLQSETSYFDEEGTITAWTYNQVENEFTVEFSDPNEENNVIVFWDTDAETGYYQYGNQDKLCWDSNFQDLNCSDVGY